MGGQQLDKQGQEARQGGREQIAGADEWARHPISQLSRLFLLEQPSPSQQHPAGAERGPRSVPAALQALAARGCSTLLLVRGVLLLHRATSGQIRELAPLHDHHLDLWKQRQDWGQPSGFTDLDLLTYSAVRIKSCESLLSGQAASIDGNLNSSSTWGRNKARPKPLS